MRNTNCVFPDVAGFCLWLFRFYVLRIYQGFKFHQIVKVLPQNVTTFVKVLPRNVTTFVKVLPRIQILLHLWRIYLVLKYYHFC